MHLKDPIRSLVNKDQKVFQELIDMDVRKDSHKNEEGNDDKIILTV